MSGLQQMVLSAGLPPQGAVESPLSPMTIGAAATTASTTYGFSLTFKADGTIVAAGITATLTASLLPRWWSFAPEPPVAPYWIRWVTGSNVPPATTSGISPGVWHTLSTDRAIGLFYNDVSLSGVTAVISISSSASGTPVVSTGTLTASFGNPN